MHAKIDLRDTDANATLHVHEEQGSFRTVPVGWDRPLSLG